MTASMGFSDEISYLITKSAGIAEIIFGIVIFLFYKYKPVIYLNIIGLIGLLLYVIVMESELLLGAFNPVTTNIPLIGLSLILVNELKKRKGI